MRCLRDCKSHDDYYVVASDIDAASIHAALLKPFGCTADHRRLKATQNNVDALTSYPNNNYPSIIATCTRLSFCSVHCNAILHTSRRHSTRYSTPPVATSCLRADVRPSRDICSAPSLVAHSPRLSILFYSADSSPAAFNFFSSKQTPSLFSLPDVAPPPNSEPITATFESRDNVVSVVINYTPYYWRRRDIFVDLPLRVAVAARRPQTNSCEVISNVRVSCSSEWYNNFDDANAHILDTNDKYAASVLRFGGDPKMVDYD